MYPLAIPLTGGVSWSCGGRGRPGRGPHGHPDGRVEGRQEGRHQRQSSGKALCYFVCVSDRLLETEEQSFIPGRCGCVDGEK